LNRDITETFSVCLHCVNVK